MERKQCNPSCDLSLQNHSLTARVWLPGASTLLTLLLYIPESSQRSSLSRRFVSWAFFWGASERYGSGLSYAIHGGFFSLCHFDLAIECRGAGSLD